MSDARPVALVGLRCVGKTSAGRALAELWRTPFVDLDDEIAALDPAGTSVGETLRRLGVARFRELEHAALREVLDRPAPFVLATGGGVVEREDNRELLHRRARCIWLQGELELLQRRLAADPQARPALLGGDPVAELPELARRREPLYREVAEATLAVGIDTPAAIARRIARQLEAGH